MVASIDIFCLWDDLEGGEVSSEDKDGHQTKWRNVRNSKRTSNRFTEMMMSARALDRAR